MQSIAFQIRFSGICIGFQSEFPIHISDDLRPFLVEGCEPDELYEVRVMTMGILCTGMEIYRGRELRAFSMGEDRLFYFPLLVEDGDLMPVCVIRANHHHDLWIPPQMAERLTLRSKMTGLLCIEQLLLNRNTLLFHSSVVCHNNRVLLFSGPSGMGKSTQALLWEQRYGAKVLNGDRCILHVDKDRITGGGSPWCGSSAIYDPNFGKVEGLFLLRQGSKNVIEPANPAIAFREIYQQCVVHAFDREYVQKVCDLVTQLLRQIPVMTLECLPHPSAAELCYEHIFEKQS